MREAGRVLGMSEPSRLRSLDMPEERTYHDIGADETFRLLKSNPGGLTEDEAEKRLEEHGPNEIGGEKGIGKLALFLAQVKNPLNAVLAAAAVISLIAGKSVDVVVIVVIIIFNALMGFIQEYRAEKALQALRAITSPEAEVLRRDPRRQGASVEMRVRADTIVQGDVLLLEAGDKVPADSRIFEAASLEIDEAMLTGESVPVSKNAVALSKDVEVADRRNCAYSGTIVTHGRGKAVVFATAGKTEVGKIASLISETKKAETPLHRRTRDLSKKLGLFALFASLLTLVIGVLRGFEFLDVLLFAIASAVSTIPEGLLVVMTITLAIGAHRMVKRNALIRKLPAVETLGSVTAICTDKTGTLTTNQMTLTEIAAGGRTVKVTGVGYAPEGHYSMNGEMVDPVEDPQLAILLTAAVQCNDSRLRRHETDEGVRWEIHGDPTEGALVVAGEKAGIAHEEAMAREPRVDEVPFDAKRRYMATFHRVSDAELALYVKGAPETVLGLCSHHMTGGEVEAMVPDWKEKIVRDASRMAADAKRVLAVAHVRTQPEKVNGLKEEMERGTPVLTFLGLVGIEDPPRPEAKAAVRVCKTAGIRVAMLTGDHKLTAEAIAREMGILDAGQLVITGEDMHNLTDEQLDGVIEETSVFARVSPAHKHRIVESLRRKGHIVAMTGDGVNDAPALKAANVGISMGITGADVTKETAEMVLADDNFASIVNAVEEGRVVFENIRKVVKYLISTNTGEILTIQAALIILSGAPLILTPIMILWINLVTDGLLDKTLALEPKEEDVMRTPPRKPDARLMDSTMIQNIVVLGVLMAAGTLFLFNWEWKQEGEASARTVAFATMAMFQVFNALNCRSRTRSVLRIGFFANKYLILAVVASFSLNVLATTVPLLQTALGTVPLSLMEWVAVVLVASSILLVDEIRKFVRPRVSSHLAGNARLG